MDVPAEETRTHPDQGEPADLVDPETVADNAATGLEAWLDSATVSVMQALLPEVPERTSVFEALRVVLESRVRLKTDRDIARNEAGRLTGELVRAEMRIAELEARPIAVIEFPGEIGPEEIARFQAAWDQAQGGPVQYRQAPPAPPNGLQTFVSDNALRLALIAAVPVTETERARDPLLGTLAPIPIRVDERLPDGRVEVRDRDGNLVKALALVDGRWIGTYGYDEQEAHSGWAG